MLLTLEEYYQDRIGEERKYLDIIAERGDSLNWKGLLFTFWNINRCFGVADIFIKKDPEAARQHFYLCGRFDELEVNLYNNRFFEYNISRICYAILSDSAELLQRYAGLAFAADSHGRPGMDELVKEGKGPIFNHCVQLIIREDWEALGRSLATMERSLKKEPLWDMDYAFYKAMLEKDRSAIAAVLNEMASPKVHKKRDKEEIFNQYISMPVLGYAKLAWQKGMEVEVDSPLVPKEILPVRPLENYVDSYSFMEGLNAG
jgi:hypothetical protein